jgi:hypothetical protein
MGTEADRKATSGGVPNFTGQGYQIRLEGHLNGAWSGWLDGMTVVHEEDGTTVLTGPVADQPALFGLLVKIRDLGLTLLSLQRVSDDTGEESGQG